MKIIKSTVGLNQKELVGYLHDPLPEVVDGISTRPAIIICPGGAYRFQSKREADPVALRYFASGLQVFTLYYSVKEEIRTSEPVCELGLSVVYLKEHAKEFCIDPEKIAVLGFSAGGHLAASLATLWNDPIMGDVGRECRPSEAVLCYPVITTGPFGHAESSDWISCGNAKRREFFSLENRVNEDTVPSFIWHTTEDQSVPVENSLLFMGRLAHYHIPFEAHLFQNGVHGSSTCTREVGTYYPQTQAWLDLSLTWLFRRWSFTS